ncbi:MAG: hypothetical protein R3C19_15360 [Planctomycetaceae bacterium]
MAQNFGGFRKPEDISGPLASQLIGRGTVNRVVGFTVRLMKQRSAIDSTAFWL